MNIFIVHKGKKNERKMSVLKQKALLLYIKSQKIVWVYSFKNENQVRNAERIHELPKLQLLYIGRWCVRRAPTTTCERQATSAEPPRRGAMHWLAVDLQKFAASPPLTGALLRARDGTKLRTRRSPASYPPRRIAASLSTLPRRTKIYHSPKVAP